jgi:hypothetical protein
MEVLILMQSLQSGGATAKKKNPSTDEGPGMIGPQP